MTDLNKTAAAEHTFETIPASDALSPYVRIFVHRNEAVDGTPVRILPELRSSVQFRLADPYWVRERAEGSPWRQVPEVSIWAPRHHWGYGYAKAHIRVFAFDLTPAGFHAIAGKLQPTHIDDVLDGLACRPLTDIFPAGRTQDFPAWVAATSEALTEFFKQAAPAPVISPVALSELATGSSGAVTKAAMAEGVSPRQFRRRFMAAYGLGPKQYQRIVRVDRHIRQLQSAPWEEDAFQPHPIPFSDEPHAIREFHDTIGMTPAEYRRRKHGADRTLRSVPEPQISPPHSNM